MPPPPPAPPVFYSFKDNETLVGQSSSSRVPDALRAGRLHETRLYQL